jgi:hypothetical protein
MRWFVEVSRVGESGLSEKYCVEAKQWQAALQEARKLRGDSGALSKFSIELLDDGYRAVDPSLKLRYLVNQAPADAPLTPANEEGEVPVAKSNGKTSMRPPSVSPTKFATSVAPEAIAKPSASGIPRPTSHRPPRPVSNAPPRQVSNAPPRMQQLVVPDDPVPRAPRAPTGLGPEIDVAVEVEVEVPVPLLPPFEVVRERSEEPRAESPITYREVAYAVKPGTSRAQVEALLWARYKDVARTIEARPAGKFVQLAVFDHAFQKRPERPPLATFAWKDWRGSPVLAFPGFGEAPAGQLSQVPPSAAVPSVAPAPSAGVPVALSLPAAASSSAAASSPAPAVTLPAPASFPPVAIAAAVPVTAAPATSTPPEAPVVLAPPVSAAPVAASPLPAAPVALVPTGFVAPTVVEAPPVAVAPMVVEAPPVAAAPMVVEAPPVGAAPAAQPTPPAPLELRFDSSPPGAASRKSSPDSERQSRPRLAVPGRRRAGEDLIGELFEVMHDLHFMRDVAAGAEFVLSVLNEVLPCEGVLIHVFDINTNHFVVVRAKGPNAKGVLLQRMRDQDPLALSVMRSAQAVSVTDAANDPRFEGPRWEAVGIVPKLALGGAVRQGGRYLGMIELVNPAGDVPFHSTEVNALDYICEQFAEFLSNRPIIVAADVILARV